MTVSEDITAMSDSGNDTGWRGYIIQRLKTEKDCHLD